MFKSKPKEDPKPNPPKSERPPPPKSEPPPALVEESSDPGPATTGPFLSTEQMKWDEAQISKALAVYAEIDMLAKEQAGTLTKDQRSVAQAKVHQIQSEMHDPSLLDQIAIPVELL